MNLYLKKTQKETVDSEQILSNTNVTKEGLTFPLLFSQGKIKNDN